LELPRKNLLDKITADKIILPKTTNAKFQKDDDNGIDFHERLGYVNTILSLVAN
jgi:hypothetical protein